MLMGLEKTGISWQYMPSMSVCVRVYVCVGGGGEGVAGVFAVMEVWWKLCVL